ncbi:hemolysin III family protein [Luteolibacter pohnpeiensis]|uniref:Hemolysin III family protein n=1 Tax=Luteolibacter pohnpeiensis TaxID=454153 RepID=A0A934S593_9BACT|nr:hemolysin III family protein [Luteolibacter pohnpeiensis]MBK1883345.1 hemolysin III family protein [Luteolibacter pohnpeiensis]
MNLDLSSRSPLCHTHREEVANVMTHAAGVLLSIAALVGMILAAQGSALAVVSVTVFGASLILLYLSSTLYHVFTTVRTKQFFQMLDHACIYLLIAGSYTPVTLISLKGPWGWSLFGAVWGLAIAGVMVKTLIPGKKDHWISTALYVVMGWLVVIAIGPLLKALPFAGLAWLVAGGLSYTLGVVFFAWTSLRFHHAIWHLFVLGGSACHVVAVWFYVLN